MQPQNSAVDVENPNQTKKPRPFPARAFSFFVSRGLTRETHIMEGHSNDARQA